MMGNINNVMQVLNMLRQNPMQILARRFNIPQNVNLSDPGAIIQHLLNSGQITQNQINNAMNARSDPFIRQLMGENNPRY